MYCFRSFLGAFDVGMRSTGEGWRVKANNCDGAPVDAMGDRRRQVALRQVTVRDVPAKARQPSVARMSSISTATRSTSSSVV
jgi:hypothetical protein